ncbi:hypothetical protein [Deinococcus sp.]|uniref:hypothetical protein n=1 Tax=Deinococcus sp. TaxID=47478 RepID=UPI003C7ECABC
MTVAGIASAPVKVVDSSGMVRFDGPVTGSKILPGLARDRYTVTAGAVADYGPPLTVTADLSGGDGNATLTYSRLPGNGLSNSQVSGLLSGWTLGAADVYFERSTQPSVKGQVEASGAVRLPIPAAIGADGLGSFLANCTFNGVATNLNVQAGAYSDFRAYAPTGDLLGTIQEQLVSNGHDVWHIYSLEDANFDGVIHCGDVATTVKLDLKKGWNYAESTAPAAGQTSGAVLATLADDARTQLAFISAKPGVYMALDNPSLDIRAGAQLTRKATVYQTGNYTGTVQLATTVAGLSVEPRTLTLAPLGTLTVKPASSVHLDRVVAQQGLSRQSVATTLTFSAAADAQIHVAATADALTATDAAGNTVGSSPLKVNLSAPTVAGSASSVLLARGQTTPVSVDLGTQSQYIGPVEVSIQGLPAGVTAAARQTTFTGTSSYQNLTLNVSTAKEAASGLTKATLVVNAGGRITRSVLELTVQQPAVQVSFPGSTGPLHQGESRPVSVSVSGLYGFSGTTTLSLIGLPLGVSAAPLTVSVTAGTSTTANFVLVATADAALGATTPKVVDTDLSTNQTSPSFQLSVRPQVVALIGSNSQLASAHDGVWVLGTATYNSSAGSYQQTLTRYTKAGSAVSVVINPGYYGNGTLIATPSGDAVVISGTGAITRYQDDGSVKSTVTVAQSPYNPVTDAQGRLWSIGSSASGSGSALFRIDLATGQRTEVLATGTTGSITLFRDAAGAALYLSGLSSGVLTKIDFSTLARTDLTLPGVSQVQALAVAQDGTLWGVPSSYSSSGGLFRLNADGTLTGFSINGGKLAFDPATPTTLWSNNFYNGLTRFDTTSGTGTVLLDGSIDIVPNAAGGLWTETSENNAYGLSLVK